MRARPRFSPWGGFRFTTTDSFYYTLTTGFTRLIGSFHEIFIEFAEGTTGKCCNIIWCWAANLGNYLNNILILIFLLSFMMSSLQVKGQDFESLKLLRVLILTRRWKQIEFVDLEGNCFRLSFSEGWGGNAVLIRRQFQFWRLGLVHRMHPCSVGISITKQISNYGFNLSCILMQKILPLRTN